MQNKAYKFYTELPTWAKGIVAIGSIAIVYFTAKSVVKRIRMGLEGKKDRETLRTQESEIKGIEKKGVVATYGESQYKTWASQIKEQFDGCDGSWGRATILKITPPTWLWNGNWSNSGALVANIFEKLKNDVDYLKLSTAFGVATYDQCGIWTGDFTGNLQSAIADELDEQERNAINNILSKNGISYKV